jgi:hypothetical protein
MRRTITNLFFMLFCISTYAVAQRELVLNSTGNGFDMNTFNGINPEKWEYFKKFASLSYNGQDASVTAIRLHIEWNQYEPTPNAYQGAKLVQAVQAILALKPGMKIALHFAYMRPGIWNDHYFSQDEIAKFSDGNYVQDNVAVSCPSVYSDYAKDRYFKYVDQALSQLTAFYSNILYVEMGNSPSEEFLIPFFTRNGNNDPGFYEDRALEAWRTQYLPCRYPGQSSVKWDGNNYEIASAPFVTDWNSEIGREYHRFAAWGLMKLYKGFRDVVKSKSPSLKVLYFVSDMGGQNGNVSFLHNSTLPMALKEMDGIYSSDGTTKWDVWKKIMAVDVIKGTDPNKIAGIEFDQEDLGQVQYPEPNSPIDPGMATEWLSRAYKHGADYIHLAMHFNDTQISQLAPAFAKLKATYLTGSYQPPARSAPVTENIYPKVFTTQFLFDSWNQQGGKNWDASDNNPKSVRMIDEGYWQNIWNCSADPCLYSVAASVSNANPASGSSLSLASNCTGNCSGVNFTWKQGNNTIGTNANLSGVRVPSETGSYTYTLTASKGGCSKSSDITVRVENNACSPPATPTVSASGNTVCAAANQTVTLRADNVSGTVTWFKNGTQFASGVNLITANEPGNYTATNGVNGCVSNLSNTVSLSQQQNCNAGPPAGNNPVTCSGNTFSEGQVIGSTSINAVIRIISGCPVVYWAGSDNRVNRDWLVLLNGKKLADNILASCVKWDGDALDCSAGCTAPPAPVLSTSSSNITRGQSVNLSASGCSGSVTWSDGQSGNHTVSPTQTTTYTATCNLNGCTSTAAITITVAQAPTAPTTPTTPPVTPEVPTAPTVNCNNLRANLEYTDCNIVGGWVYNPDSPNTVINLDVYEGNTLIQGNFAAGNFRQDLVNAGFGNGRHGYEFRIPAALKDGQSHTFTLRASGCNLTLGNAERTINCSNNARIAAVEEVLSEAFEITEEPLDTIVVVSPNPTMGKFEVSFVLTNDKEAKLSVIDTKGVRYFEKTAIGKGLHQEPVDLSSNLPGLYMVIIQKEKTQEVKKVIVIR